MLRQPAVVGQLGGAVSISLALVFFIVTQFYSQFAHGSSQTFLWHVGNSHSHLGASTPNSLGAVLLLVAPFWQLCSYWSASFWCTDNVAPFWELSAPTGSSQNLQIQEHTFAPQYSVFDCLIQVKGSPTRGDIMITVNQLNLTAVKFSFLTTQTYLAQENLAFGKILF